MSDNIQFGPRASDQESQRALLPAVDIFEDASGITVLADLPGVQKDRLDLKVEGNTLLISGEVGALAPADMEPLYAELSVPRYRRGFTLSPELDPDQIQAQLKDGVLKLRIPKMAHAQPRRIAVSAG